MSIANFRAFSTEKLKYEPSVNGHSVSGSFRIFLFRCWSRRFKGDLIRKRTNDKKLEIFYLHPKCFRQIPAVFFALLNIEFWNGSRVSLQNDNRSGIDSEKKRATKSRVPRVHQTHLEPLPKYQNGWRYIRTYSMKTRSFIGVLMHARSLQFDVGVQRYMSLKATQHEFFRPTTKNTILGVLLFVIPYCSLTYIIKRERVCIFSHSHTWLVAHRSPSVCDGRKLQKIYKMLWLEQGLSAPKNHQICI